MGPLPSGARRKPTPTSSQDPPGRRWRVDPRPTKDEVLLKVSKGSRWESQSPRRYPDVGRQGQKGQRYCVAHWTHVTLYIHARNFGMSILLDVDYDEIQKVSKKSIGVSFGLITIGYQNVWSWLLTCLCRGIRGSL